MGYRIDLDRFELVLSGDYVKYYAVNCLASPVAPFGISGKPLTLDDAKTVLKKAIKNNPQDKYRIEEAKLHISLFDGYQHLNPCFDDKANMVRGIND